jgi:putative ABC transport system permease protein
VVIAEVALSLALLVGAGLLVRSFAQLQRVSPGFAPAGLLTAQVSLPAASYSEAQAVRILYDKLAARLSDLPGVEGIGAASVLPLSGINARTDFTISGRPPATPADTPAVQDRWVSPGYFHTMRIPLVDGRDFIESDDEHGAGVAVIDETLARRHWPDTSPIGEHLLLDYGTGEEPRDFEIVGIAGNIKHVSLNEEPTGTIYAPLAQIPPSIVTSRAANLSVVVRGVAETQALARALRHELQSVDPLAAASSIKAMSQYLDATVAARRFNMLLMSLFAGVALLLATAGLYALLSYSVMQRTHEFGVRMALGAGMGEMLRLVIRQGLTLASAGIAMGLVASLALTRLMSSLLFGVGATDPLTFAGVAALLAAAALLACCIPAWRAARVDPMIALRNE